MKKLLVICGPTATGKTSLALRLVKKYAGELVSADSRQVYKNMDIGTGKDLPVNIKYQISNIKWGKRKLGYYEINKVKLWGYDLVGSTEEFSVAQYIRIARSVINDIWDREQLPILVGGTGLYIKGVIDGIPTSLVPKNITLRKILEKKSVSELYELLASVDPTKAAAMNSSDRRNSRRLVRAIEVARWKVEGGSLELESGKRDWKRDVQIPLSSPKDRFSVLFIGLKANNSVLRTRIRERVEKRLRRGILDEIEELFKKGVTWNHQSMQALGYKEWQNYFSGEKTKQEVIYDWLRTEFNYAKRQMTWFKRERRINWFDVGKKNFERSIEMLIDKWYSKS